MKRRSKTTKLNFKPGDPIEIECIDHTTDVSDGWIEHNQAMKSTPLNIHVRGYYVGQDATTIKIAFAKCGGSYSNLFNIVKGTLVAIRRK